MDADHDEDAPLRFRTVDEVVGPGSPPGIAVRDLGGGLLLAISTEEPASLAQAKMEVHGRQAMEEELSSIQENNS